MPPKGLLASEVPPEWLAPERRRRILVASSVIAGRSLGFYTNTGAEFGDSRRLPCQGSGATVTLDA